MILISGCQDNQTSMDGDHNGAFTEQLLKVWNKGAYRGQLRASSTPRSRRGCRRRSRRTCSTLGPRRHFARQQPFSV